MSETRQSVLNSTPANAPVFPLTHPVRREPDVPASHTKRKNTPNGVGRGTFCTGTSASTERIGQLLIQEGIIDAETERQASRIQAQSPSRKFGEILVQDLGVDHHEVFSRLAGIYAFKSHDLNLAEIDEEDLAFSRRILSALPDDIQARTMRKRVLPLRPIDEAKDMLLAVTPDPTEPEVLEISRRFGFRRVEICYCRLDTIEALIGRIGTLSNAFLDQVQEGAGLLSDVEEDEGLDEAALDAEINQSMLTNLVEGCLVEAVRKGASDIHIVPEDTARTGFYFRLDGKLQPWLTQESTKPEAVIAVVKDRARGVDRFERDRAQDGFIQREIDGRLIRFRVSVLPLAGSQPHRRFEDVVIRILDDSKVICDLDKLGLQPYARDAFNTAIRAPQGMVILTGPTGSGKSTTLNAALHHVMDPSLCAITIEDPVEFLIRGARQIKIGRNLRFEDAVRTILRHDPDIVMVGEIRDQETAETAIKMANTGHLTFTTLHTNDAPSAVSRLYKMGVEPFLIASAVTLVVAQRLIRTLCPDCKSPADQAEKSLKDCLQVGMTEGQFEAATLCKPVGCPACNGTGYRGRVGIHEALPFGSEVRQLIVNAGERIDEDALRRTAVSLGMQTLKQSGMARVIAGETTLRALLDVTGTDH